MLSGKGEVYKSKKNTVVVKICGNEYTVTADESVEYIRRVTDYVNEEMTAIHNMDSRLSTNFLAVLTAINCADKEMKLKKENEKLLAEIKRLTEAKQNKQSENN